MHLHWKQCGRPTSGPCYDDLKNARNDVKNCLRMCRACLERRRGRDEQFKSKDNKRFLKPRSTKFDGSRIMWHDCLQSDLRDALSAWNAYFSELGRSRDAGTSTTNSA